MDNLIRLIKQKKANISIIGLGYVGLPLAVKFSKLGFNVYGYETDLKKISNLNKDIIYVDTIKRTDFIKVKYNKFNFETNSRVYQFKYFYYLCTYTYKKK